MPREPATTPPTTKPGNNTVSLRGSATITAGVTCYNVTDCLPYWTSKGSLFQGNTYRVPSRTGENWALSSPVDWASWRAIGFDTTGDIIVPDGGHGDHRRHGVIRRRACRARLLVEVGRRSASAMRVLARSI
jgi:hypothetical protein